MTARLRRVLAVALLAGAGVLMSAGASAQPHAGPPEWQDPAGPPVERDVWLRRLVGTFRADGLVHVVAKGDCGQLPPDPNQSSNPPPPPPTYCETIKGLIDCVGVGTGPGVQCIMRLNWQDLYETVYPPADDPGFYNLPGGVANMAPAMALLGLDPGKSSIDYLLVDQKGLPEGGPGFDHGSRVTFTAPCVNWATLRNAMRPARPMPRTCERIMRIDTRLDTNVVYLSMDIEIDEEPFTRYVLTLRRVPPVQTSALLAPASDL